MPFARELKGAVNATSDIVLGASQRLVLLTLSNATSWGVEER